MCPSPSCIGIPPNMSPKGNSCAADKKGSGSKTSNGMDRGQVPAMLTSLKWRRANMTGDMQQCAADALDTYANLEDDMKKQFLAQYMSLKNSDKKRKMKELTTQFSISKKRDMSTRSEMGMFTAAKILEFNGASFKDFANTEKLPLQWSPWSSRIPRSLNSTRRLRTAPLHSWSSTATRTHRESSPAKACLTSNRARLVPRPPLCRSS